MVTATVAVAPERWKMREFVRRKGSGAVRRTHAQILLARRGKEARQHVPRAPKVRGYPQRTAEFMHLLGEAS